MRWIGDLLKAKIAKETQSKFKVKHLLEWLKTWESGKRALYISDLPTLTKKFSKTSARWISRDKHLLEWSQHRKYCKYTLQIWHNE